MKSGRKERSAFIRRQIQEITSAGIPVYAIYSHQQDLEGYFLDLMGKESKTGSSKKGGRRHA